LRLLRVIPLTILVLLAAQSGVALTLSGRVTDGQGVSVSGAMVELTNEATGRSFVSDTTDAVGTYLIAVDTPTAVLAGSSAVPEGFQLLPNYPNPFNPSTVIAFNLDRPSDVRLAVYNSLGHPVQVLLDGRRPSGQFRVTWHGVDQRGFGVAAGVYFYRLEVGSSSRSRKMTLIDGARTALPVAPAKTALPAQAQPDLFSVLISGFDIETLTLTGQQIDQREPLNFEVMRIRDPLVFDDPFLFSAVRRASQIPEGEITLTDVAGVRSLEQINSIVSSLGGIEILTRLEELRVGLNRISDLSPLAGLSNLRWLSLSTNEITDITPLAGLVQLEVLTLDFNRIVDLSPLTGLINLRELALAHNPIGSLEPLSTLFALNRLILTQNHLVDISALGSLINLEVLFLDRNMIEELGPLSALLNLRELGISLNRISDLSPLEHLPELERLIANNNRIARLESLANIQTLTHLQLSNNGIRDIGFVAELPLLQELDLTSNEVSDLGPLAGLQHLRRLSLASNEISDLSPLMENLAVGDSTVVSLAGNPLSDLAANFQISALRQRGVDVLYESPLQ
jgi:Leucine-rich repeat (LRR) protein